MRNVNEAASEPLDKLKRGYAAFDAGDYETVLSYLTDDVVWEQSPGVPEAGTFTGRDQVRGWFGQFTEIFHEVRIDALRYEPVGPWIAAEVRIRGRGGVSEIPIDMTFAQGWRYDGELFDRVKEHTSLEKLLAALR